LDRYNLYYNQDLREKIFEISKGILFARTYKMNVLNKPPWCPTTEIYTMLAEDTRAAKTDVMGKWGMMNGF
jgi:hypothetical protein